MFTLAIFIEHPLCARHCPRCWGHSRGGRRSVSSWSPRPRPCTGRSQGCFRRARPHCATASRWNVPRWVRRGACHHCFQSRSVIYPWRGRPLNSRSSRLYFITFFNTHFFECLLSIRHCSRLRRYSSEKQEKKTKILPLWSLFARWWRQTVNKIKKETVTGVRGKN